MPMVSRIKPYTAKPDAIAMLTPVSEPTSYDKNVTPPAPPKDVLPKTHAFSDAS